MLSILLPAVVFGVASAVTLPLGAAIAMVWQPSDRIMAMMLAFGGGALIATVTVDLVAPGVDHGHFAQLALGAIAGGIAFKLLDAAVNRKGGYLRKPSTAMTHWRQQARDRLHDVLVNLRRTQPLGALSPEAEDRMLSVMLVCDIPEGTSVHRAGDPAGTLYFIEDGAIDLIDPAAGGKTVDHLTRYDAFGLLSFATGMPRTLEAVAVRDTRVLMLPRQDYMDLLPSSDELRALMVRRIGGEEAADYLRSRHGMSAEAVAEWQAEAVRALETTGHFDPPRRREAAPQGAVDLLKTLRGNDFFRDLSDETLQRFAARLIRKTHRPGHAYYHRGQPAERFYVLTQGTVHRFDPTRPQRRPAVLEPGTSFGGFAFLTEGLHAVTAIGHDRTEVLELRRADFDALMDESADLRAHVAAFLKHSDTVDYVTSRQGLEPEKAARWIEHAATSVARGKAFPPLSEMTREVSGHGGAAMAMYLGILLDGIPESFVVGAHAVTGGVSLSLVAALFLANLPEALSSAAGMKAQGMATRRILWMWVSLMMITGLGAGFGAVALRGADPGTFALIEGLAVGAMLTMIAETMLPEAFHKGGGVVGLSTLAGFLATAFFASIS